MKNTDSLPPTESNENLDSAVDVFASTYENILKIQNQSENDWFIVGITDTYCKTILFLHKDFLPNMFVDHHKNEWKRLPVLSLYDINRAEEGILFISKFPTVTSYVDQLLTNTAAFNVLVQILQTVNGDTVFTETHVRVTHRIHLICTAHLVGSSEIYHDYFRRPKTKKHDSVIVTPLTVENLRRIVTLVRL